MQAAALPSFDLVDRKIATVLREKSEAERLAIAHGMWKYARNMLLHIIRSENPGMSADAVASEAARRLAHGSA